MEKNRANIESSVGSGNINALESDSEQRRADHVDLRAAEAFDRWKSLRAEGKGELAADDLSIWVLEDVADYHSIGNGDVDRTQSRIAENSFAYPPYADALRRIDPSLAKQIRPQTELLGAAEFFRDTVGLLPEKARERIDTAPEPLRTLLADAAKMAAMDTPLKQHLHWIPTTRLDDLHAVVAATLQRDDQAQRERIASEGRASFVRESSSAARDDPALLIRHAQMVADFIAANKGLLTSKIRENIANAGDNLRAVLASPSRMSDIEQQVNRRLTGISATYIGDVQSVIASELGRPDAAQRAQNAARLHKGEQAMPIAVKDAQSPQPGAETALPGAPYEAIGISPWRPPREHPEQEDTQPLTASRHANRTPRIGSTSSDGEDDEIEAPVPAAPRSQTRNDEGATTGPADEMAHEQVPGTSPSAKANMRKVEQNGFAPDAPQTGRPPLPIGDLLERMSYTCSKDGSVLYPCHPTRRQRSRCSQRTGGLWGIGGTGYAAHAAFVAAAM